MIKSTLSVALVLALTGCASINNPDSKQAYVEASIADTASTAAVLGTGVGYEANPIGFAGATAAKYGLYLYAKDLPEQEQKQVYHTGSAAFSGYSINNLLVLLGAPTPVSLIAGLIGAAHLYFKDPEDQKPIATAEEKPAIGELAGAL